MGDWNLFFATSAGSAATLLGLLFVATQLHIEVFTDQSNRWAASAQSTLTILAVIVIVSLFFLFPEISLQSRGPILVAIIVFALWRAFTTWLPVFRAGHVQRRLLLAQSVWLLIVPILAYAYLSLGAVQLLRGDRGGVFTVAGAFLSLFSISLRNAWRLVVSVERKPA